MRLSTQEVNGIYKIGEKDTEDDYIFKPVEKEDYENKILHVYPKYKLKNGYLLYTSKEDFENDKRIKQMPPFQKSIAFLARDIFGNFVPQFYESGLSEYFSSLTMSITGRIVDDRNYRVLGTYDDITKEYDFEKYFDSLKEPATIVESEHVLKKELKL